MQLAVLPASTHAHGMFAAICSRPASTITMCLNIRAEALVAVVAIIARLAVLSAHATSCASDATGLCGATST